MSSTLRTLGAGALGALIVAVAVLALRPGPVSGAPATDTTPAQHTITVSGSGVVTIVPDVARINLGVTVSKSTLKAVREAGAAAMNDIIAAVKALGVAEADIQTTNLSLSPQYGTGSAPKIIGYQISEQIVVTVRDLDKAGDVVDAAVAKGANNVNGISFESGRSGQGSERRTSRGRGRRTDQRTGDGHGGQRLARGRHLDHGCVSIVPDLVRRRSRRRDQRPRDPGRAGHPGPDRHGHRDLRDQLVSRRDARPAGGGS